MPFARPTLSEIITRIESDYESRIDNAQSLLRRSVLKILSRAYGAAVHLLYGYLSYIKDQPFATTADSEYLEKIGNEFGIARKPADYATGSGSGTGTIGVSIPAGTQLVSNAGQVYSGDVRARLAAAFGALHGRGVDLLRRLWEGLTSLPDVRVYGPPPEHPRTPTVGFVVGGVPSEAAARAIAGAGGFVSHGDFYAHTAVARLGLQPDGIVRAGCACYTTADEVERLLAVVRSLTGKESSHAV